MQWYPKCVKKIVDNDLDYLADTMKCAIVTSSYTYSENHEFFDSLTNEVTGTNYTAGGVTLASKTTSIATTVVPCVWDCDDITIAQSGAGFANGRRLAFYKSTGVAGTSALICSFGASADFGNVSGTLTIQIASTGLVRVAVS
jgi:hypothetical protein